MAAVFERYALRPARSPREWAAYHAIRRDAIFAALLPGQPCDEQDADEFVPDLTVRTYFRATMKS